MSFLKSTLVIAATTILVSSPLALAQEKPSTTLAGEDNGMKAKSGMTGASGMKSGTTETGRSATGTGDAMTTPSGSPSTKATDGGKGEQNINKMK